MVHQHFSAFEHADLSFSGFMVVRGFEFHSLFERFSVNNATSSCTGVRRSTDRQHHPNHVMGLDDRSHSRRTGSETCLAKNRKIQGGA
jgi:hypothetical protein